MTTTKKIFFLLLSLGVFEFASLPIAYCETISHSAMEEVAVYKVQGDFYLRKGESSLAIREYQKAVTLSPNTNAYFNLAIAYYSEKEIEKATAALQKVVEMDPDDVEAHYNLASLMIYLGNMENAKHHLEKAKSCLARDPLFSERIEKGLTFLKDFKGSDPTDQEIMLLLFKASLSTLQIA